MRNLSMGERVTEVIRSMRYNNYRTSRDIADAVAREIADAIEERYGSLHPGCLVLRNEFSKVKP